MGIKKLLILCLFGLSSSFNPNINNIPPDVSKFIVKTSTGILPKFDAVAHHVLHSNKLMIDFLMDNNNINMSIKKPIILFLIQSVRNGDEIGSHILSTYYDIVNHVLQ